MYDVVKSDPNYMKHSYRASAQAIQAMMNEQHDFKNIVANNEEDDDEDQY